LSRAPDEYAGFTMTLMRMLAFMPEDVSSPSSAALTPKAPEARHTSSITKAASAVENIKAPPKPEAASTIEVRNTVEISSPSAIGQVQALNLDPAASSFSEGWITTASRLKLSGMPKMLAQHCEVKQFSADEIEFCVPELHRHLLDKSYQDRLQAALREYLGKPVRLKFSIGVVTGLTPAELENREKQARQSQAVAAIESDPFVRDLVENFDAKLIASSIKPIQ
jgi:DNA polymerase-3 subunit gamma/tau